MANDMKEQIIAQLIATGMDVEEAEKVYKEQFEVTTGVSLPFPLLKVNNVRGIAEIGQIVGDPEKDEDGEVIKYNIVYDPKDIDILIINRKSMYNMFDPTTNSVSVKTKLQDPYTKKVNYIDVISGKSVVQLIEEGKDVKPQTLLTIGIRPKGSDEPFTPYNMYIKGTILYGMNQLISSVTTKTPYTIINMEMGIGKQGAVKFAIVDLDNENTTARAFEGQEMIDNINFILETNKVINQYVEDLNRQLDEELMSKTGVTSQDALPA